MNFKGLSQVLYLIIAAAVLMMVGLSLVFAFTGSTNTSTVDRQACAQSLRAQCQTAPSNTDISTPSVCTKQDNSGTEELLNGISGDTVGPVKQGQIDKDNFQCS